ncbi:tetratricopeptide repeat protein, partial [Treponema endosymbiont of Eucomonympha sp.]|uniref:tetratricopeptide repeat protein n=1 Tax=Treponema endosymbiont of Eucomonympha sp. TaxID=1580831 RepID=UPI000A8F99F5
GIAYVDKGDCDKAIADCDEAIRLQPDIAGAFIGRGLVYYFTGKFAIKHTIKRIKRQCMGGEFGL